MPRFIGTTHILKSLFFLALVGGSFFAFHGTVQAGSCEAVLAGGDIGQCLIDVSGKLVATLLFFATQIFAVVLGWVGFFFNMSMSFTVFRFASYFGNSEGVLIAWTILRDLANIALLFAFVFIGISTILNIQKYSASRALPTLIIFAVLLNFSLFISEAVIDISNATASTFYTQAISTDCRNAANQNACANQGIPAKIMELTGISTVFSGGVAPFRRIMEAPDGVAAAILFFGLLGLHIVLIGVLAAGAIILVVRGVTLVFVFVTSPLGLAGAAIPPLSGFSKDWWNRLVDNAIFAPAFVLLILIGLKIVEGVRTSLVGREVAIVNILQAPQGTAATDLGSLLVLFALIIGFFWMSLDIAKRFGGFGSDQITGAAKRWIGNTAGAFTVYPVAAGAQSVGKAYNWGARGVARGVNRISAATPAWLKTTANVASLGTTYAVAKGIRGGASAIDRGIKNTIASADNIKIPGTGMESYEEMLEATKRRKKEMGAMDDKEQSEKELNEALASNLPNRVSTAIQQMSLGRMEEILKDSDKHLAAIAENVSPERFDKLIESKELAEDKKNKMLTARFSELIEAGNNPAAQTSQGTIRGKSVKDLEMLAKHNSAVFERIVSAYNDTTGQNLLSNDQIEGLSKLNTLTQEQKNHIQANTFGARMSAAVRNNPQQAQQWALSAPPQVFAKLSADVLMHPTIVNDYNAGALAAIMRENNKLSRQQLQQIGQMVRNQAHPHHQEIANYFRRTPGAASHFS